jgi:hypothetical protein
MNKPVMNRRRDGLLSARLARIIHDGSSRKRANGSGEGHEVRGLEERVVCQTGSLRHLPLAPCFSPEHPRLQQKQHE